MTARNDTYALISQLAARGISASFEDANTLRRAQLTLHRWHELECGDGNDYASWHIERDEKTGVPYFTRIPHHQDAKAYSNRIPDREAGAVRRVAEVCKRLGLHYFVQTDPRGCALYVSAEPLPENDYTRGIACCA